MVILYILLAIIVLWKSSIRQNKYPQKYIDIGSTNAIKGISICLVFFCHISGYFSQAGYAPNIIDKPFYFINYYIGQLCVVMFLFYSGFGVVKSIALKGDNYVRRIPRTRCLNTLINFDVAVLLFIITSLCIGKYYTLKQILLSLIAWDSVGNSNWYIFAIITMYIITYIAKFIAGSKNIWWLVAIGSIFYILLIYYFRIGESWWTDTVLAYSFGIFYSEYQNRVEHIVEKQGWGILFILSLCLFLLLYTIPHDRFTILSNMESILFAFLVVLITMKIKIENGILHWLGKNLFPIYIYQRLPMIVIPCVLGNEFLINHIYIYVFICIVVVTLLASLFKLIQIKI